MLEHLFEYSWSMETTTSTATPPPRGAEATLQDLLAATEVPAANEIQCGWGAHHTLEGAQRAARDFLRERDQWEDVGG